MARSSHRRFISYIDRSREYYAAKGFEKPYRWAITEDVAFSPMAKPLADATIGVVTTSGFHPGHEPNGLPPARPRSSFAAPTTTADRCTANEDLFWARDETHTDDPGAYLPVAHLQTLVSAGRVGAIADRFYGVPTAYSARRTETRDAPKVLTWMREDQVDIALLVPL